MGCGIVFHLSVASFQLQLALWSRPAELLLALSTGATVKRRTALVTVWPVMPLTLTRMKLPVGTITGGELS